MEVKKPEPIASRGGKKLPPGAFRVDATKYPFSVAILFVPGKKAELVGKWDEEKQRGDCFIPGPILHDLFAAAAAKVKETRQQEVKRAHRQQKKRAAAQQQMLFG